MLAPPSTRINFEHLVPRLLYSKEMSRTGGRHSNLPGRKCHGMGKGGEKRYFTCVSILVLAMVEQRWCNMDHSFTSWRVLP